MERRSRKKIQVENKKKFNPKVLVVIVFVLLVVATVLFSIRYINFNVTEMLWRTSVTRGSDSVNNKSIRYFAFNSGLMRISNDGITYIDSNGNLRWTISYNMKEPIYESSEHFFLVADRNGYNFYMFDKDGLTGQNTTTHPIQKITMSKDGVIYILQSDENSSYVNVYRSNCKEVDINIKTTLTGDGMPIDISTSMDGTELVMAYTCLTNDNIYTKATYYNFDETGINANSKRIVGEFIDELEGMFLARAHYFNDNNSCLIYDGGVYFVSTKNDSRPVITKKYEFENKIKSVSYNRDYLALVFEDNRMLIFDSNGTMTSDKIIDFDYENFYVSENYAIFIYGKRVMIYDSRGRMVFDKTIEMGVQYIAKKKSLLFTELLVGLIDGVECIRFY